MFDVGFWELLVVGIVALIVIGPERLPGVARTVGLWVGRMRRFVAGVKADIEREVKAEELKRIMEEQAKSSGIHEIIEETQSVADELNRTEAAARAPAMESIAKAAIPPAAGNPPANTPTPTPATAPEPAPQLTNTTPPQNRHG